MRRGEGEGEGEEEEGIPNLSDSPSKLVNKLPVQADNIFCAAVITIALCSFSFSVSTVLSTTLAIAVSSTPSGNSPCGLFR